jgi:hypothetical protein
MLLFLDTEFTGLNQSCAPLISIALVPADGRNPFYAELNQGEGWTRAQCNPFVLSEVLPLLTGPATTLTDLKARLAAWLTTMPRSNQIACDSELDFQYIRQLFFNKWPENLNQKYFDLRPMADTTVFDKAVGRYYTQDRPPHHALHDAHANRLGWLAWADAKKINMD